MLTIATIVGGIIGAMIAVPGTYYGCVLTDRMSGSKGGGNGLVTIGCLFFPVTIPLGAIVGGLVGTGLAGYFSS